MEATSEAIQWWKNFGQFGGYGAVLVGIIIGIIAYVNISKLERKQRAEIKSQKEEEQHKLALQGQLKTKNLSKSEVVNLWLGEVGHGFTIQMPTSIIKNGYTYEPLRFGMGSDLPFVIKVINDKIFIDAEFRSLDNKLLAKIKNNKWIIAPNNYFQKEFDDNKLEVIDPDGIVNLQMDFTDQFNIKMAGAIYDGIKLHYTTPTGFVGRIVWREGMPKNLGLLQKDEAIKIGRSIKRLFPEK